jgi:hypothetical protein
MEEKMLSKDTEFRLDLAMTDDKVGGEIAARVEVTSAPVDAAAAQAILDILDRDKEASIEERLFVGLAGDGNGSSGKELSKKIVKMADVLEKFIALDSLPPLDPGIPAAQAALDKAKTDMGAEEMSESARYSLEHSLTSKDAADEFKTSYDAMVAAIQSL